MNHLIGKFCVWQVADELLTCFGGNILDAGLGLKLTPECRGISQCLDRQLSQPEMLFLKYERLPTKCKSRLIALEQSIAGSLKAHWFGISQTCQPQAGCQAHQIERVRQAVGFIKVVNAPNQTTLFIALGAKILEV